MISGLQDFWNPITPEDRKKLVDDIFACGFLAHVMSDVPSRELVNGDKPFKYE